MPSKMLTGENKIKAAITAIILKSIVCRLKIVKINWLKAARVPVAKAATARIRDINSILGL